MDVPLRDYFAIHQNTDGIEFHSVHIAAEWMGIDPPDEGNAFSMLEFSFKLDAFIRYKKADAMLEYRKEQGK